MSAIFDTSLKFFSLQSIYIKRECGPNLSRFNMLRLTKTDKKLTVIEKKKQYNKN